MQRTLFFLLLSVVIGLVGCAKQKMPADPFVDKWEKIAEETQKQQPTVTFEKLPYNSKDCIENVFLDDTSKKQQTLQTLPLPKTPITLDIRKPVPVGTVLQILAQSGNVNILFNATPAAGLDASSTTTQTTGASQNISLTVHKAPWADVFTSILSAQGLSYIWDGSIIRVMSLHDLEHMNKLERARRASEEHYGTGMFRLHYADVNDVKQTVADFIGAKIYGTPYGGERVTEKVTEGSEDNSSGVLSILRNDSNEQKDNSSDEVGTDMMYARVIVDQLSNTLIIRARQNALEKVKSLIRCLDKPRKKILISAYIVKTSSTVARDLGIQWNWGLQGRQHNTPIAIESGTGTKFGINLPVDSVLAGGPGASGNILLGSLNGDFLELQLSALASDGKVNILSSPSIVTLDNQGGYISNGVEVPYQKSNATTGQTEVSYEFKQAVLKLEIIPRVIDAKTIKLKIAVTDNSVDRSAQLLEIDDVPSIRTRETETVMTVADNQTIVISGLTETTDSVAESGIPGLKDIPGVGWLGKGQQKEKIKDQLMVFIRPTIIH